MLLHIFKAADDTGKEVSEVSYLSFWWNCPRLALWWADLIWGPTVATVHLLAVENVRPYATAMGTVQAIGQFGLYGVALGTIAALSDHLALALALDALFALVFFFCLPIAHLE